MDKKMATAAPSIKTTTKKSVNFGNGINKPKSNKIVTENSPGTKTPTVTPSLRTATGRKKTVDTLPKSSTTVPENGPASSVITNGHVELVNGHEHNDTDEQERKTNQPDQPINQSRKPSLINIINQNGKSITKISEKPTAETPLPENNKWRSILRCGDELSGQSNFLRSPNGRYEVVFTSDCCVEVYLTADKPIGDRSIIIHSRRLRYWQREKPPKIRWLMTEDGHLEARDIHDEKNVYFTTRLHASNTEQQEEPTAADNQNKDKNRYNDRRLEIRNDGNVILYHGNDNPVWKTTTGEYSHWSIQTLNTFGSNAQGFGVLRQGSTIYNGDYLAKLENDGQLCVYQLEHDLNGVWKCDKLVWSNGISGSSTSPQQQQPFRLFIQPDGDVMVRDGRNTIIWRTNTKGSLRKPPGYLDLSDDGFLQLHDGDERVVWRSGDDKQRRKDGHK